MIFNSIRWRLQAWHGLILVLVLAGFGLTAYQVARDNQLRGIDQELGRRLMLSLFGPGPPGRPPERGPDQPPGDRPGEGRRRFEPAEFRLRMREAIEKAGSLDAGQTNAFYYVLWQEDGTVLAQSAGAPKDVPLPERIAPAEPQAPPGNDAVGGPMRPRPGPPPFPPARTRTRGERREAFRNLPGGETLLVGRSITRDLAAMRRLAFRLVVAGAGVLLLGLAGGWWLATRAIRPIEDISATALKIAAGDLSQRINAADTDSELGRLAGVLNSTFGRLEAAFAHQARFTSDASHELRTPVSVVLSQTQTALSRERSPAEYRAALEACQRAAQRMRKLTRSLLELARLDAGQEPIRREPFDLARVTRECVELVRPLAAERGVEIHCDLPAVQCLGDAERISQVATNLLSNAIHFNRPGGEVRVSTRAENGAAVLTVADTGEGIPAQDLPHIFERFYRVDKSRSGVQGQTGLGLAISKAVVEAHSGTIEVASQPGAGSSFSVKLPLQ
ncbi:MAG: HAMP domain-containing sensor histidine kinase [Verrucomicrobiota bacterium]|jgi:heavy metal sensor kinase